jgi:Rrf2 family protein
MSHISTGVEYGLHCLLYLSHSEASVEEASVRDLAELQGIPAEFLAKLFTKLAKAELVVATEGIKGGFRLARPAHRITVHDVVVAIDGDKPLFDCREIRSRCAVFGDDTPAWATRGVCSIHAIMQAAEKAMRAELKQHTLADLVERTDAKAPAAFGEQVVHWLSDRAANRRPQAAEAAPRARRRKSA